MTLTINKALIDHLRKEGFYPDTLFTMLAATKLLGAGQTELLDALDDFNSSKRMVLVYYDLVRMGYWKEEKEGSRLFSLTEKGVKLLEDLYALENSGPRRSAQVERVEDWFDLWMDQWPRGIKSGGKLIRSDKKACLEKMKKFVRDYGFASGTIIQATDKYLVQQAAKNWEYTKCATYFIHKQGEGSELAAWCDQLLNKDKIPVQPELPSSFTTGLV